MLLKLAKSNQPVAVIIIPLLFLIIWFSPFNNEHVFPPDILSPMPLYQLLLNLFPPYSLLSKVIAYVLVLIIIFQINRLNTKFIFISERTFLPEVIYIVILSSFISFRDLLPVLPGVILFLVVLERILVTYKYEGLSYNIFDAGLCIGIASMFYFSMIFYIIFLWATLIIIRKFYWREWVFTLLGIIIPYFVLFSIYYLFDIKTDQIFEAIAVNLNSHFIVSYTKTQYIILAYLILLILISSQHLLKVYPSKKILARKSFSLFLVIFLLTLLIYFIIPSSSSEMVCIAAVPLSIVISHLFVIARKSRWLEILFDILIIIFLVTIYFKQ